MTNDSFANPFHWVESKVLSLILIGLADSLAQSTDGDRSHYLKPPHPLEPRTMLIASQTAPSQDSHGGPIWEDLTYVIKWSTELVSEPTQPMSILSLGCISSSSPCEELTSVWCQFQGRERLFLPCSHSNCSFMSKTSNFIVLNYSCLVEVSMQTHR